MKGKPRVQHIDSEEERISKSTDRPPVTHLVVVIDESSSMDWQQKAVIRAFNAFLKDQQELRDPARMSVIIFNARIKIVAQDVSVLKVQPLSTQTYWPQADTALWDATKKAIDIVDADFQPEDRAIILVMTDGGDSGYYTTAAQLNKMLTERIDTGRWSFVFMGFGSDVEFFRMQAMNAGFPEANLIVAENFDRLMADISDAVCVARVSPNMKNTNFFNKK